MRTHDGRRDRTWLWGSLGLFAAGLVGLLATSWWLFAGGGPASESLPGLDPAQVEMGRAVYQASCAQCHGLEAEGAPDWRQQNPDGTYPPPPHDSTGHTWHHGDGLLYRIVRDGGRIYETPGFTSAMPAFGNQLSPEEIRSVITYLKTLWGPEERAFQSEASEGDPFPDD